MITDRMMSLLTDLSIVTELLRQLGLWVRSPEIKTGKVDGCGCNVPFSKKKSGTTFGGWIAALEQDFKPPRYLILRVWEKLYYPEHKKHGPDVVATMGRAEDHLDRFWAAVDSHCEAKTGVSQHRVIRECLEGNGEMHRTAPWDDALANRMKPAHVPTNEYQPFPDQLHDRATQITGAFDKIAVTKKVKPKTQGSARSDAKVTDELSVEPRDTVTEVVERIFKVNKRTYNVFRALLSAPLEGVGDVTRSAKWLDFRRAMVRMGFSAEKLQGSAWQFVPTTDIGTKHGIQFHEPHPDSEITYVIAKRMGRRLGRVRGRQGDMFQLV